jgi:FtsZ-binding cell division protein ZapB
VVVSELTHRDRIDTFEGAKSDVDVLASYVPIRRQGPVDRWRLRALPECDPFVVAQLQRSLWWATAAVALVFAALYLMQFLIVRRAQGILEDQEGRIKAARDTLELQVEARTDELKRTNSQLESEIAERRQAQSKLNYLAYHDPLTGLANRRCFIERLEESLRETARHGERLAVLFIDLDQFKQERFARPRRRRRVAGRRGGAAL